MLRPALLSGDLVADGPVLLNENDGFCTPADFSAWIANFNAGC